MLKNVLAEKLRYTCDACHRTNTLVLKLTKPRKRPFQVTCPDCHTTIQKTLDALRENNRVYREYEEKVEHEIREYQEVEARRCKVVAAYGSDWEYLKHGCEKESGHEGPHGTDCAVEVRDGGCEYPAVVHIEWSIKERSSG